MKNVIMGAVRKKKNSIDDGFCQNFTTEIPEKTEKISKDSGISVSPPTGRQVCGEAIYFRTSLNML